MKIFSELVDLLMPSKCAVCESSGSDICVSCLDELVPRRISFSRGELQGRASFYFDETVSKLITAFKEKGQATTSRLMASLLGKSLSEDQFLFGMRTEVFLVPAPSRKENSRARGYQPSLLLASQLARDMKRTLPGQSFRVLNCLSFSREVKDQVGLNKPDREKNIHLSMVSNQKLTGKLLYLVDDTVTTGSTALECQRALEISGGEVLGILAFAVSSSNNPTENPK